MSLAMRRSRLMPASEIASRSPATGVEGCCACSCASAQIHASIAVIIDNMLYICLVISKLQTIVGPAVVAADALQRSLY